MSAWILFALVTFSIGQKAGLASFQQEFRTKEACLTGSRLLIERFSDDSNAASVKTFCMEVAK